jgi:hypothetical protein
MDSLDDLIKNEIGPGLEERVNRKVLNITEVWSFYEKIRGVVVNGTHMKHILGDYLRMYRFCQRIRDNELDMDYVKKQLEQML